MAKTDMITLGGIINEVLPNTMFKVKLETGPVILGHISGKMRQNKIQILAGDKVVVEMSPYDISRCRICYRDK